MTDRIGRAPAVSSSPRNGRLIALGVAVAAWAAISFVSALQGQLFAAYHGRAQDWWATLGYTAAVFSVWALLAPLVLNVAGRLTASRPSRAAAILLWFAGYAVVTALHVLIFVVLFWPVYGTGVPTPLAMAEPVLLANLDKSVFAYVALTAFAHFRRRRHERLQAGNPPPFAAANDGLWIRVSGGSHRIGFAEIDWIAAAGDYAEIHAGGRSLLTDRSLAALSQQLPADEFARVHRGAIVRIDRVREMHSLGRGDASLLLRTGQSLRLSRRYRKNLTARLPV